MKFKTIIRSISLLVVLIYAVSCDNSQSASDSGNAENQADLVINNGSIYTANDQQPTAEAVAVADGKIIFVGSNEEAKALIGENTEVLDLQGQTLTPGFIESHGHFMSVGYGKLNLELMDTKSYDEIIEMVAEEVKKRKPGEWILGRGWHQSKWEKEPEKLVKGFQVHDRLSAVSPDNPVWLTHASGHAGFANAKAMEIAGVFNKKEIEVEGGEVIRDEKGQPTGLFNETAKRLISKHVPEGTPEMGKRALELAIEECHKLGITSFHDAGVGRSDVELFKDAAEKGELGVRIYAMVSARNRDYVSEWLEKGPEVGLGDNFLTIRAIKIHADGALGSRGAWLLEPYSDRHDHHGLATEDMEYVAEVSEKALEKGFQVCTHAIGDRTNRETLDKYQAAFEKHPDKAKDARYRIEHAQHISEEDIPRFGQLGVIASMQAIHMSSDRPWAIDRLGKDRIEEGAYVWQKLLQSGAKICNGTDAPVEPLDPIPSFYASVARKTLKGEPEGGYEADQKMTREQALISYTLDGAYAAFEEDLKGSIEVGKVADFTVFTQDIMKVPEDQILDTKVAYTIIDGEVKYKGEKEKYAQGF